MNEFFYRMEVCDSGTLAFTGISLQLQRGSSYYRGYEFHLYIILLKDTTRSFKERNINRLECQLHDKQRAGGTQLKARPERR
jgi:hypothetical protein